MVFDNIQFSVYPRTITPKGIGGHPKDPEVTGTPIATLLYGHLEDMTQVPDAPIDYTSEKPATFRLAIEGESLRAFLTATESPGAPGLFIKVTKKRNPLNEYVTPANSDYTIFLIVEQHRGAVTLPNVILTLTPIGGT